LDIRLLFIQVLYISSNLLSSTYK